MRLPVLENNKDTDQLANLHSLIRVFIVAHKKVKVNTVNNVRIYTM